MNGNRLTVIKINKDGTHNFKKFTCSICNSACGLLIEAKENKILSIKPDKNHPLSKGYCCPKGLALGELATDKDRVLYPLKRMGTAFKRVSWKEALSEIANKLKAIRDQYSPQAIAYYMGTNSLQHYAHSLFVSGFMDALGSYNIYNAGSVDNNNNFVAQHFLYGSSIIMPIPDLPNTDLFIVIGSNPVITHLSLAVCSNVSKQLKGIKARGGEIYVIDPRKNETAKIFANDEEHYIPIVPNTDIFLLLSMINIILSEDLEDKAFLQANTTNVQTLKELINEFTPERAGQICHIPAEKIYRLTHKFVQTKRAVMYGRIGTCLATFSTLNAWAIEVLNIITGKLDRPGGKIFGKNIVKIAQLGKLIGLGSYDKHHSRIGNYPDVMGAFPLGTLAREMLAKNPVHALIISGGNPLLSAPNSNEFEKALKHLELCVVLDFYINETALHTANYILPVKTPLENSNFHAIFNLNYQLFPHIEYVEAAVTPDIHGPKAEWEILLSLVHLLKLQAFGNFILDFIPKFYKFIHKKFDPEIIMRILLFVGQVLNKKFPYLSSGALTLKQLKKRRTLVLGSNKYGVLKEFVQTKNKKINLTNTPLETQIDLCKNELRERLADDPKYRLHENEFYLIGRRLLKTSNSWLHNIKSLWGNSDEPKLLINTHDAERLNLSANERVLLENEQGAITLPLQITGDIMPNVLCYPHGWGHKNPQLSFANKQAGENINTLTNSFTLDQLSGMPLMNGYKVKLVKTGQN